MLETEIEHGRDTKEQFLPYCPNKSPQRGRLGNISQLKGILLILGVLISGIVVISIVIPPTTTATSEYIEHAPIRINGNDDFHTQAAMEGWDLNGTRDGTPSKPYLIEKIKIKEGGYISSALYIGRTDVYFEIRNVFIRGHFTTGIKLVNVQHGLISSNLITYDENFGYGGDVRSEGIHLSNSENNTLINNTIQIAGEPTDYKSGITLSNSKNNIIKDTTFLNTGLAIFGDASVSGSNIVTNNTVNNKPLIYWEDVTGGTIPSGAGQVILVNCKSVTVTDQHLYDTSFGIQAVSSSNLVIANNTLANNQGAGIQLYLSTNLTLTGNTVITSATGIDIRSSNHSILWNNTVFANGYGLKITNSFGNTISGNTITNSGLGFGIEFSSDCDWNLVEWNNLIDNLSGTSQANDEGSNNVFANNYWDEHDNTDNNGNGIADTPYGIDGSANNQDATPSATLIITPGPP